MLALKRQKTKWHTVETGFSFLKNLIETKKHFQFLKSKLHFATRVIPNLSRWMLLIKRQSLRDRQIDRKMPNNIFKPWRRFTQSLSSIQLSSVIWIQFCICSFNLRLKPYKRYFLSLFNKVFHVSYDTPCLLLRLIRDTKGIILQAYHCCLLIYTTIAWHW